MAKPDVQTPDMQARIERLMQDVLDCAQERGLTQPYTEADAASIIGVSAYTLRCARMAKRIRFTDSSSTSPVSGPGRRVIRFTARHLAELLAKNEVEAERRQAQAEELRAQQVAQRGGLSQAAHEDLAAAKVGGRRKAPRTSRRAAAPQKSKST